MWHKLIMKIKCFKSGILHVAYQGNIFPERRYPSISNKLKGVIIYLVIIFLLIFGLVSVLNIASNSSRTTVTYSGVISEFDDLNVAQYQLDLRKRRAEL